MLFVLVVGWLTDFLNLLYGLLPSWTVVIGTGQTSGATDGNFIYNSLRFVMAWDRFIPLHECFLPIIAIVSLVSVGLGAFKAVKFVLSLIPTINAGG